ncbi:MAG: DUF805 domain-containing protein [Nocardioidaceae bacterium]
MSFTEAVSSCFRQYAGFSGRARRSEFWYFALFLLLLNIVMTLLDPTANDSLVSLVGLLLLVPTIAVTVRRLHDTNRTGWWVLVGLVPLAGFIVLLVFEVLDSTPGPNRFGPSPKYPTLPGGPGDGWGSGAGYPS